MSQIPSHLSVDIETRSSIDISDAGAYRYAQSDDFEILLIAYAFDDAPVTVIDVREECSFDTYNVILFPEKHRDFFNALNDPGTIKHAYNAAFEWWCLNQVKGIYTPVDQWRCTLVHALYCGYPAGLSATGKAMGIPEDKQKLATGSALIRYFCTPARATKKNGGRQWNEPHHDPEKWQLFKEYNARDVDAERAILRRLNAYPMPEEEMAMWRQDTLMNAVGARVDRTLVDGAMYIDAESTAALMTEAKAITHLDNPNSNTQLQQWLTSRGVELSDMTKATVAKILEQTLPDDIRRVLEIRQQTGKTSVKKYKAMHDALGKDDRIRGLMQYYGANRSGRWAGRLVQTQNLPRNYLGTLDEARRLVRSGDYEAVRAIYGNVPDTLSQLIRTAFIPSEGNKLVVADFSAIEARVIAWLADEAWVNEVFATHGKIYEATAAQMFHVPIETIAKGKEHYDLRQKGKVATLALGYQGGPGALTAMGALEMGLTEEELPDIVSRWRSANANIVSLWHEMEEAAVMAIQTGQRQVVKGGRVVFALEGDICYGQQFLTMQLPSGRKLFYARPSLKENKFGKYAVHFYEVNAAKKWAESNTYSGKLTENCVQAIARDCLAESLRRIAAKGLQVVFHVHDEVVIDAPRDVTVDEVCDLISEPIGWAPGLILKAAGFEGEYYKKD